MKLAVIIPGALPDELCKKLNAEFSTFLAPDTQTAIIGIGDATIQCAEDIDRLTPPALAAAQKAEQEGFDGIVFSGT